jgi:hypothetical protein
VPLPKSAVKSAGTKRALVRIVGELPRSYAERLDILCLSIDREATLISALRILWEDGIRHRLDQGSFNDEQATLAREILLVGEAIHTRNRRVFIADEVAES